jgi:cbb3-type cytochrome oxidase subunit 1
LYPKAANRPVYSYRLSIVHFGHFIFFIHLGRTTPFIIFCIAQLGQNLGGCNFVIMPSLGGMINVFTLDAWDKVRVDPVLKFSVAITGYGMATKA